MSGDHDVPACCYTATFPRECRALPRFHYEISFCPGHPTLKQWSCKERGASDLLQMALPSDARSSCGTRPSSKDGSNERRSHTTVCYCRAQSARSLATIISGGAASLSDRRTVRVCDWRRSVDARTYANSTRSDYIVLPGGITALSSRGIDGAAWEIREEGAERKVEEFSPVGLVFQARFH